MKYNYLEDNFIGHGTKNGIMHHLGLDEISFDSKVRNFEMISVGIIRGILNIEALKVDEEGKSILKGLCSNYVSAKLLEATGVPDYFRMGEEYMIDFRYTLNELGKAQDKSKIDPYSTAPKKAGFI